MSMNPNRLWAKSKKNNEAERPSMFLPNHLVDVYHAANRVLDATADAQLAALGLTPVTYRDRLRRCVLLAAAIHDLGKANDHFQGMILRSKDRRDRRQGIRHEWVTVLLLREQPLREWFIGVAGGETDAAIVEWAVSGHHPAYNRETPPRHSDLQGAGDKLVVHTTHLDFQKCLSWLAETFGGSLTPFPLPPYPLIGPGCVSEKFGSWYREAARLWDGLPLSDQRFVAAVKACLLAADVAGSALPLKVDDPDRWIAEAFANLPSADDLDRIVRYRLKESSLRPFQRRIADSTALVTFVKAGCGTGKTLAAYRWAADQHPGRRLYFCYPTTGTATEGFKDYLYPFDLNPEAPDREAQQIRELGAKLFHGRADVDLAGLLTVSGDETDAEVDAAIRFDSLDTWGTPIVSCTVDTVLGLIQNSRRGLFAWPALAQSAFVFDEIHAYDDTLFGAMLRFLQAVPGVPVLLMTASLPQARRTALDDCLKRTKRPPLAEIGGPEDLEKRPRYQVEPPPADLVARVKQEFNDGGKVLWVSNTVKRAMAAAASIAGCEPKVYHSRFRYCDRVERHNEVVMAFKPEHASGVVACCTQVAEMSLDLKGTTLLVTELAPVPALIQRLGRLNRDARPDDPVRPFIVIDVGDDHLPYTPAELDAAREWLKALGTGPLSQRDLAEAWQKHDATRKPNFVASAWLDGGPVTQVLELRTASPGITVVREVDAGDVKARRRKLAEVAIPMPPPPRSMNWREWDQLRSGVPVAPADAINYDPKGGAEWVAPKAQS